ncbi:MAG TPA: PxKF domain-containing protein [Anaerolineales bacterium]|nr:PxKF domain-containing protein [Anaerolineales bacterium]HRK87679.1 PxKF domain-containing protein [Anaerolineales bacterium]
MFEKNPSTKNIVNFIVRVTAIVFLLAVALFAQGKNFVFAQGALLTAPSVTTGAAAGVSYTSATLYSLVNPNGLAATVWFRYSTTDPIICYDGFGTRAPASGGYSLGSGTSDVGYSHPISGLTPGEVYYFCAIAENDLGKTFGSVLSFTTLPSPLTVTTGAAAGVAYASATLYSLVNPNGLAATVWFRYSTTDPIICYDGFGTRAPASGGYSLGSGTSDVGYSHPISGLTPGEVYYFCAIAENSLGKKYGSVLNFTTPPSPLTVTTFAAAQVTSTTATLNSFVNPNGFPTTMWFRYSTTNPIICYDDFGTRLPTSSDLSVGSGSTDVGFSYPISGLTPGEVYYFCAIAENSLGKKYGSVLNFTTPPSPDNNPPATTIILNPGAPNGSNGWYTSDVHLTVSASDGVGGSGVAETRCVLDPVSVPATFDDLPSGCSFAGTGADVMLEGAHTIYAASKDNTGNKEPPKNQTFKLDKSKPSASLSAAGTLGNGGWYIGDVTVITSGTDSVSNPVTCTPVQSQTIDTTGVVFDGSCTNDAGLSMNAAPITIKRDAAAPVVTVIGVTNGATYSLGAVPDAGCSTTDATSGVAATAVLSLSGGPVGNVMATCSGAEDNAGNFGQASVTFNVAYNWTGFFQPVDNLPTLNLVSAGRAIPVKFSLGGDQGLNIFAAGYPKSEPFACSSTIPVDGVEDTLTAGSSSLSYDPSTDQYTFVWKTEKSWVGTCRQLVVKLMDGTFHRANFKFK